MIQSGKSLKTRSEMSLKTRSEMSLRNYFEKNLMIQSGKSKRSYSVKNWRNPFAWRR
jgi:hypothetical protein